MLVSAAWLPCSGSGGGRRDCAAAAEDTSRSRRSSRGCRLVLRTIRDEVSKRKLSSRCWAASDTPGPSCGAPSEPASDPAHARPRRRHPTGNDITGDASCVEDKNTTALGIVDRRGGSKFPRCPHPSDADVAVNVARPTAHGTSTKPAVFGASVRCATDAGASMSWAVGGTGYRELHCIGESGLTFAGWPRHT